MTDAKVSDTPRIVLTFNGLLVDDNSPLLNDTKWLQDALSSKYEDGAPMLRLSIDVPMSGQAAVEFVRSRLPSPDKPQGARETHVAPQVASIRKGEDGTVDADSLRVESATSPAATPASAAPASAAREKDAERYRWLKTRMTWTNLSVGSGTLAYVVRRWYHDSPNMNATETDGKA